jgi:hypothetical protein
MSRAPKRIRWECKEWEKCQEGSGSTNFFPCIVEVEAGAAEPENCPYSCWSGISCPDWQRVSEKGGER